MVIKNTRLLFAFFLITLLACKKDPAKELIGEWKMLNVQLEGQSTQQDTLNSIPRILFKRNTYTTVRTYGLFKFADDNSLSLNTVEYTPPLYATSFYTTTQNGIVADQGSKDFFYQAGPFNVNKTYHVIDSDSLYVPQGILQFYGATQDVIPEKFKFDIKGDQLTISATINKDSVVGNYYAKIHYEGTDVIHFQRN